MGTALAFGIELLTQIPALIAAGKDVISLVNSGKAKMQEFEREKRDPTSQEWLQLNAEIDDLRLRLHDTSVVKKK